MTLPPQATVSAKQPYLPADMQQCVLTLPRENLSHLDNHVASALRSVGQIRSLSLGHKSLLCACRPEEQQIQEAKWGSDMSSESSLAHLLRAHALCREQSLLPPVVTYVSLPLVPEEGPAASPFSFTLGRGSTP